MGVNFNVIKSDLDRAMDMLRMAPSGWVQEDEMRIIMFQLQSAENVLIQNEKKIWLRTNVGKEMLGDFGAASEKLLDSVMRLQKEPGPTLLDDIKATLLDLECQAKKLNAETRRRSMVVT